MRLTGRVLYLLDDPVLMRRQLDGGAIAAADALGCLRDDISTDEIIPARYCLQVGDVLAAHCYRGLRSGTESVVGRGSIAGHGFEVSVAGLRRGKGSSREHAPYAEQHAGIRLVLASSFERIYRQNCHNLGLVTSTRLDLLPALEAGADIPLDELCADLDDVARMIVDAGGLFPYTRLRQAAPTAGRPAIAAASPLTLAGGILAAHSRDGAPLASPGAMRFFRTDLRYSHEYVTAMAELLVREHAPDHPLADPDRILLFEDHLTALARTPEVDEDAVASARELARAQEGFAAAHRLRLHGRAGEWSEGICHMVVTERYAEPGQLVVGSDSHTCHVGALGCLAVGVGTTDIANAWVFGDVLLPVPRDLLVMVDSRLGPGVTEKDLMLHLLAMPPIRAGRAIGTVVEFAGEAVSALDIDARCTLTNMTAEMGAVSGIVAADERTAEYLIGHRGMARAAALARCGGRPPDPGAFDEVIRIDAAAVQPMVSLPGDPGNAIAVAEAGDGIRIGRAYGGSCTAAKPRDMDMYATVLGAAVRAGRRVHPDVEFFIQAGSQAVLAYCADRGYLDIFERAGATVLGPSCGACINAGPGASTTAADVAISAQNRNFPGRSGPGRLYLASPLTVAASALEGRITQYGPRW